MPIPASSPLPYISPDKSRRETKAGARRDDHEAAMDAGNAPLAPIREPNAAQANVVLGLLFLFQTLNFFDKLVFGLSAVPMMHELGLSPKQFGLIGSSFFLLFSLSGTLVGLCLTGRVRTKWILAALAVVWCLAQFPIAVGGSVGVLITCRVLLGAGEGPGLPSALHAAYDWFPAHRRSLPSAVILQGISVGFLVGSPFLTAVILRFGWHAGFLVCGCLGVVWVVLWAAFGADGPYAGGAESGGRPAMAAVPARALWLDPTIVGVMIMSFTSYWVVGMAATWLPPYLELGLGYGARTAGWIISGVYLLQSPLLLGGGWLSQTMRKRGWSGRVCLGYGSAAALFASGAALIAATHSSGAIELVVIAVGFAAPSLTTVFGPVILSAVAPPVQRGKLVVVIYSANAIAGLISTYATGWIVDAAGVHRAAGFAHAIGLAGLLLLIGAVVSILMLFPERSISRLARHAPEEIT